MQEFALALGANAIHPRYTLTGAAYEGWGMCVGHQLRGPSRNMMAGTSMERITNVSSSTCRRGQRHWRVNSHRHHQVERHLVQHGLLAEQQAQERRRLGR